jgi:predicted DNA-binding antitoxin AbrB/MazE fold protein
MTFKGTFRNGVIIPEEEVALREGEVVEITRPPLRKRKPASRKAVARGLPTKKAGGKPTRMTAKRRLEVFLSAFGSMKNKPEWQGRSSAEIAREIRTRASRRSLRG